MSSVRVSIALAAALSWTASAMAATVTAQGGAVVVNGGKAVKGSAKVNPGDSVSARARSQGQIVHENGCIVNVGPGQTVTVTTDEQCQLAAMGPTGGPLALGVGAAVVGGVIAAANANTDSGRFNRAASP